jgi:hypothetical protein
VFTTRQHAVAESQTNDAEGDSGDSAKENDGMGKANNSKNKNANGNGNSSTVYEDLEKLEHAITMENADLKLRHSKLKEHIDFIDQCKRLVVPDALRFIIVPMVYAFGLYKLLSRGSSNRAAALSISTAARWFTKAMDAHFWIFVVGSPLLLNASKVLSRRWKDTRDPIPDELRDLDPVCATVMLSPDLYDYEDPRASCDDTVSFLVEYWTSAVNSMAVLFAGKTIANALGWFPLSLQSGGTMLWLASAQLLTRLAAVVSLYQYPEKLYDLERSELTRPVGFFQTLMPKLVRWMMAFAPLGLISDFSKVLLHLPRGSIYPLYASIIVYLFGTWTRMKESVSTNKDPLGPNRLKPPKPLAKIFYGMSFLALWRNQLCGLGLGKKMKVFAGTKMVSSFPILFWKTVGMSSLVLYSLLGPLIHLKAFSKIFEVEYTNDLPVLSTKEFTKKAMEERPERAYNMAWRYGVRWRKPQRLTVSKGWIYHDMIYWYLFKGSVMERINNDRTDQIQRKVTRGRTIEKRISRELELLPKGRLLNGDVEQWKTRAMDFQAQKHEFSYEIKSFEDPLGIAIYKAFGIGIGYNFDHMSELPKGEEPSPRRLQARAAKAALVRYNELNDAEQALIAKMNENKSPSSKDQTLLDNAKKEFDREIEYLSGKLKELIPTTSTVEEFGLMDAAKFQMKSEPKYRKVSPNEYRKLEEDPMGYDDEPSILV